ncbi:MAG: helix-hairpin-helix domain-containing protein [Burkholderiales bacterium]|nr:helix-hairpin-helix domain-containing protein [Burkholderiales bacterium]
MAVRNLSLIAALGALACAAAVHAAAPAAGAVAAASAPARRAATAAQPAVLVDINGADRKTLMTLPGIGAAEADKIIAGRPYLSKAFLVTKKVLPMDVYQGIRGAIVARQKNQPRAARGASAAAQKGAS